MMIDTAEASLMIRPRPLLVGVGGTVQAQSSTSRALAAVLAAARAAGARTSSFDGPFLSRLPHYDPKRRHRTAEELALVDAIRAADGLVIASPGYHGGISGLVKNAIDLFEETAGDPRPYLDRMPVGIVVTAYGAQAATTTLSSLRNIVHALRGWPTPLGAAVVTRQDLFSDAGDCRDPSIAHQLGAVAEQVVGFASASMIISQVFKHLPGNSTPGLPPAHAN